MLSRIMTVSYKKETLTDWLDRFLSLTEEKFSSSKFVFSAKEHESFGNAFNICLIEDNYVVDVFWDGCCVESEKPTFQGAVSEGILA